MEIVIILLGFILIFLITREFWCWYWKINRAVDCLEDIRKILHQIQVQTRSSAGNKTITVIKKSQLKSG